MTEGLDNPQKYLDALNLLSKLNVIKTQPFKFKNLLNTFLRLNLKNLLKISEYCAFISTLKVMCDEMFKTYEHTTVGY